MITIQQRGNFDRLDKLLKASIGKKYLNVLSQYGQAGVAALSAATPKDTGKTASSWSYEIVQKGNEASIIWKNSNINKGVNIAIIIQYGHGTRNGAYVQGIDYINPTLKPIFDELANAAWKEVTAG